ncbi:hypothetical protein [Flagellimonas allohymeniacidonis]|nr:hypothetical protein [Allomuricauda hymeniacidonis]
MKNLRLSTTILLKVIACLVILTLASCDDDDDSGYGAMDQGIGYENLV